MSKSKKRSRKKFFVSMSLLVAVGGGLAYRVFRKTDESITVQVEKVRPPYA